MTIKSSNERLDLLVTFVGDTDLDDVAELIESYSLKEEGWDFSEGRPSPKAVIDKAKQIYRYARDYALKAEVYPGVEGGITLVFYGKEEHSLEICINNDTSIDISYEIGYGSEYEYFEECCNDSASIDQIRFAIKKLAGKDRCEWSESSMRSDIIQRNGDLILTASGLPVMVAASQSWTPIASRGNTAEQFVSIFPVSIQEQLEFQSYTG